MERYVSTAVVVGGSSGIGLETCTRLSARGWNVINISRSPCKNVKVKNIIADVAAGSTVTDVISKIGEKYKIDALIYCAGFSMAAPIEYAKESDYRYLFDVNFFGALKAVQACIPSMKDRGGRIILVGSLGGEIPIMFDPFYSSSKAALEMFVRGAYHELKPYNIKITAFLPQYSLIITFAAITADITLKQENAKAVVSANNPFQFANSSASSDVPPPPASIWKIKRNKIPSASKLANIPNIAHK